MNVYNTQAGCKAPCNLGGSGGMPPRKFLKIKCPESGFGGISATKCNLYIQPLKTKLATIAIAIYNTVA